MNWKSLINKDIPKFGSITDKTIETNARLSHRCRGSVRTSTSRIMTDAEVKARREKALKTPLP